jgi:hypothetical protein
MPVGDGAHADRRPDAAHDRFQADPVFVCREGLDSDARMSLRLFGDDLGNFYGMARPSFRRSSLAGEQAEGDALWASQFWESTWARTEERTALINQLRAILLERGLVAAQRKRKLQEFLADLMDDRGGDGLSARMILLVADARAQWAELDRRIAAFDAEFAAAAKASDDARRLTAIPGFGALTATALIAAIGRGEAFEHARDFAAWLGLVPRQFTTGGKAKLLGISKRGNKYLRKMLIHGARAALPHVAARDNALGRWAKALLGRTPKNIAIVALANKLARIAWAVLRRGALLSVTTQLSAA